jgi:hypothetical protein
MANLVKANVIGGISTRANLMKMKEAAQIMTITLADASEMSVLFDVVILHILYSYSSHSWSGFLGVFESNVANLNQAPTDLHNRTFVSGIW